MPGCPDETILRPPTESFATKTGHERSQSRFMLLQPLKFTELKADDAWNEFDAHPTRSHRCFDSGGFVPLLGGQISADGSAQIP